MFKNVMNKRGSGALASGVLIVSMSLLCLFMGKFISVNPYAPLLIIISFFLFILAFIHSDWAMGLLIIAMLLSPEIDLGGLSKQQDITIRIEDLLIVVFMLGWLARIAVSKGLTFIRPMPLNRYILFYCIVFVLATFKGMIIGNVTPIKGMFFMFKYIEYFIIFYLASSIVQNERQIRNYLKLFLAVFVIVNIYAFSQVGHVDRVSAPFQHGNGEPNTLGGYQVLMLGVLMGILTQVNLRLWKWPLMLLAVFTLVPFAHTLSRASYGGIVLMYFTLIFFSKFSTKIVLVGILAILLVLFLAFKPDFVMHRLVSAVTPEYQQNIPTVKVLGVSLGASPSARILDWIDLFQKWRTKPFLGFGLTGVRFVDGQYIKVLVETGLTGFVAFGLLLIVIFRQVLRIYKRTKNPLFKGLAIGFLAGHMGMLAHAFSANTFIIIRIMEPYWFLAGMVMVIPYLEKQDPAPIISKGPEESKTYLRNAQFLLNSSKDQRPGIV
jgi:O-antigen ligase